ncbi:hypothetical protein CK203_058247 [Vitis vinifera]|uniref:Uncharacterized protein n=1 Tax=Vitis vinifera TaxID=29760 RepID=A0A438FTN8_VITVI|nr:hypothetical protein CK203_058247 [Vitis vinifera]
MISSSSMKLMRMEMFEIPWELLMVVGKSNKQQCTSKEMKRLIEVLKPEEPSSEPEGHSKPCSDHIADDQKTCEIQPRPWEMKKEASIRNG